MVLSKKGDRMKKKLMILVSAFVLMLGLCSCAKQPDEETYAGYTSEMLQASCENTAQSLIKLTPDEIMQYVAYYENQAGSNKESDEAQMELTMLQQWAEVQPQVGEFVGFKNFEVTKAGKTISAVETISFEKRDVTLTYVISAVSSEVTAINVQIVYSKSEIMAKAGLNTIMAMAIVFVVLILIAVIIYCFNIIPYLTNKMKEAAEQKNKSIEAEVNQTEIETVISNDETDDLELVAVITAAIAASTGASTDDFVVRSIKRRY